MNLPIAPPTDSLYKFMTIFGLALMIASIIFLEGRAEELQVRSAIWETRIKSELKAALEQMNASTQPSTSPFPSDWEKRKREIIESDSESEALRTLVAAHKRRFWYIHAVFFLGLIVAIAGFWLWYGRIQIFQDEMLKLQVKKARKDVGSTDVK